ncbi:MULTISPECIES: DUF3806 domain-containing protein [unclassified Chelatococcus]|uniref:DUF3806 domain-containing protein n=1 Tax=unclassified Chelatococcus TaxID=2638111 RepID=UPI001BD18E66|nr:MULTISPECIES: DUF3806 domain-containing protein [unclassified Chelatococcus]MBS7696299.1 DUF3806 domain-containing protein [Chelatococcus sp. YT9]MBX3556908.1 DUF3806 domain-containing protein [Chelatococcus sp.]
MTSQRTEALAGDDAAHVERQREWVRGHFKPEFQDRYETIDGKLRIIQALLTPGMIEPDETWKLQSLGITFGDVLAQKLGLTWIVVDDAIGRDPALQDAESGLIIFVLTMISKRVETGEEIDVHGLYNDALKLVTEQRTRHKAASASAVTDDAEPASS